jgi:hypothetical protein
VKDVYHGTTTSRVRKCQTETVTKNWTFHEPVNMRIQNRLIMSFQKMRGLDIQIVSPITFECIIYNMEEGMMLEFGIQFLNYGGSDANCFIPVCPVVTCKRITNDY